MNNQDPFDITDEYIQLVAAEIGSPDYSLRDVLEANARVRAKIIYVDAEQWRDVYDYYIPEEVILQWLSDLGWSTYNKFDGPPLLDFNSISDPEDSHFKVLGEGDWKYSIAKATKKAYFKWQDQLKEERRTEYLRLKAEFDPIE